MNEMHVRTAREHLNPSHDRWDVARIHRHPSLPDSLAVNDLPSIPTGDLLTYDAVLADLLKSARQAPRRRACSR